MPKDAFGNHVIQYPPEYSVCTGCSSCQMLCGMRQDGVCGHTHGGCQIKYGAVDEMTHHILVCQHCTDHPCYDSCPKKDVAMCMDDNGIVFINEAECIGCGLCAKHCKFQPSRIILDKKARKAHKCDLCRTRPEGPLCVEYCPAKCLGLREDPIPYEVDEQGHIVGGGVIKDAYSGS